MKALFKKEFRDVVRWTPLAIALSLAMLWMNIPSAISDATQVEDTLFMQLGFAAAIIATAFGLLQSLFDTKNDSRGYLLHRPFTHQQVYWAKVASGFAAYLMSLFLPVIIAAFYLNWKGIERLPTNGLQVIPFSFFSLAVFLLHPTALWIANRDARWVGTRMLPVVGVAGGLMMVLGMYSSTAYQDSAKISLAVMAVVLVILFSVVLGASRHAFSAQSYLPPASSPKHRNVSGIIGLTLSAVVLYGVVGGIVVSSIPNNPGNYTSYRLRLNQEGQWQQFRETRSYQNWNTVTYAAADLGSDSNFEVAAKDELINVGGALELSDQGLRSSSLRQFTYLGQYESDNALFGQLILVESGGRLLIYRFDRLEGIITPDGGFRDPSKATGAFRDDLKMIGFPGLDDGSFTPKSNPFLVDGQGIFQLNLDNLSIRKLVSGKFGRVGMTQETDDQPAMLWTTSDDQVTAHKMIAIDEDEPLPRADDKVAENTRQLALPQIVLSEQATYKLGPFDVKETASILGGPDGAFAITSQRGRRCSYQMLDTDSPKVDLSGQWSETKMPEAKFGSNGDSMLALIPPSLIAVSTAWVMLFEDEPVGDDSTTSMIVVSFLHAIVAAILLYWLALRRELSPKLRLAWAACGAALGLGSILGLLAVFPKPIKEPCPGCRKKRRVDLSNCEKCGQPWDPPAEEGIEVIELPSFA